MCCSSMALKMACGENPKRVYERTGPSTRMGNVAGYRKAFIRAQKYREEWDLWLAGDRTADRPDRDLALETLAEVLRGNILIQAHCYRADDMLTMLELAQEFGLSIRSFHHAVEAYKIREWLAEEDVAASMWVDWWGFKMEAFDGIPQNIALVSDAGVDRREPGSRTDDRSHGSRRRADLGTGRDHRSHRPIDGRDGRGFRGSDGSEFLARRGRRVPRRGVASSARGARRRPVLARQPNGVRRRWNPWALGFTPGLRGPGARAGR